MLGTKALMSLETKLLIRMSKLKPGTISSWREQLSGREWKYTREKSWRCHIAVPRGPYADTAELLRLYMSPCPVFSWVILVSSRWSLRENTGNFRCGRRPLDDCCFSRSVMSFRPKDEEVNAPMPRCEAHIGASFNLFQKLQNNNNNACLDFASF